jgi:propanol-preferring alcohol dehydrogenase
MRSMQLAAPGTPLRLVYSDPGRPGPSQVLVRVRACGVCRTDLHIVDGELPRLDHPIVPGHEVVGTVAEAAPRRS